MKQIECLNELLTLWRHVTADASVLFALSITDPKLSFKWSFCSKCTLLKFNLNTFYRDNCKRFRLSFAVATQLSSCGKGNYAELNWKCACKVLLKEQKKMLSIREIWPFFFLSASKSTRMGVSWWYFPYNVQSPQWIGRIPSLKLTQCSFIYKNTTKKACTKAVLQ